MSDRDWPWPVGAATGIGSLPGSDIAEAQRIVLGELPALPHVPELPARGPGADLIGRTAGLLVELPVELYAARWRVAPRPGKDLRRARDLMERDLDQLAEQAEEYAGTIKIQAGGPLTLAASLELPIGGRMLRDPGAVRDLAGSLAEGLRGHVEAVARRLPRASVLLQLDEPSLPTVLAGRVPTESGLGTYRAVESETARALLRGVIEAAGVPTVVHCCASDVPLELIRSAGAVGVALDLSRVTELDPLGEALDAGLGLLAGAVPTSPPPGGEPTPGGQPTPRGRPGTAPPAGGAPTSAQVADRVRGLWDRLGFPRAQLAEQVVVTPACGLAGATPAYARAVLAACRDAGRRLAEV
ncbi:MULTISPECIES: methionine synthase [Micromonospora]|uniref:Methionine synthase n=1 Tax=Micromonospora maris TaxID=1003110 RepID=A0A9X0I853_9ACTN|nr:MULTISPECIES: methionine synthase [Micromonospora]KUJ48666.1 methionine synthase [Micromonospora maris]RUL93038.1 methionine synthase [Verrucosispora sp. FIM060022]